MPVKVEMKVEFFNPFLQSLLQPPPMLLSCGAQHLRVKIFSQARLFRWAPRSHKTDISLNRLYHTSTLSSWKSKFCTPKTHCFKLNSHTASKRLYHSTKHLLYSEQLDSETLQTVAQSEYLNFVQTHQYEKATQKLKSIIQSETIQNMLPHVQVLHSLNRYMELTTILAIQGFFVEACGIQKRMIDSLELQIDRWNDSISKTSTLIDRGGEGGVFDAGELEEKKIYISNLEQALNDHVPLLGMLYHDYAQHLEHSGHIIESQEAYRTALKLLEKTFGSDHEHTNQCRANFAMLYEYIGNIQESTKLNIQAMKNKTFATRWDHPFFASLNCPSQKLDINADEWKQAYQEYQQNPDAALPIQMELFKGITAPGHERMLPSVDPNVVPDGLDVWNPGKVDIVESPKDKYLREQLTRLRLTSPTLGLVNGKPTLVEPTHGTNPPPQYSVKSSKEESSQDADISAYQEHQKDNGASHFETETSTDASHHATAIDVVHNENSEGFIYTEEEKRMYGKIVEILTPEFQMKFQEDEKERTETELNEAKVILEARMKNIGMNHLSNVALLIKISVLSRQLGNIEEAHKMLDEAFSIVKAIKGPTHMTMSTLFIQKALIHMASREFIDAETNLRTAYGLRESIVGNHHLLVALVEYDLFMITKKRFLHWESFKLLESCLNTLTELLHFSHPRVRLLQAYYNTLAPKILSARLETASLNARELMQNQNPFQNSGGANSNSGHNNPLQR